MFDRNLMLPAAGTKTFFLWGARQTGKSTLLRTTCENVRWIALPIVLIVSGCATTSAVTSAVMLEGEVSYPPTKNVHILFEEPKRPFKQIAILESTGPVLTSLADLLESMREKARAIGAHAVIPVQDASTKTAQNLLYNPWLGGYQTVGGDTVPIIRGVAIKYLKRKRKR